MPKVGDRVGAVLSATKECVNFLGFGVYEGDFVPEENTAGLGSFCHTFNVTNPRIRLDNGKCVYGAECWWAPEEQIRAKFFDGRDIVEIDIDEYRATGEE